MCIDYSEVRNKAHERAKELFVKEDRVPGVREYADLLYQFERDIIEEIQESWNE